MISPIRCSQVKLTVLACSVCLSQKVILEFLSEDMTYSCAIFQDLDGDLVRGMSSHENGNGCLDKFVQASTVPEHMLSQSTEAEVDELHEAQVRKLNHIIRKARIFPGQRILEIGTGWGSLAILIASTIEHTTIDTITLSVQQRELAMRRIKAAGLEDRITVHLMDYRDMPMEWKGVFDRVLSIEMVEAVGVEFLEKYWRVVDWAMRVEGGAGVVQAITLPETRMPQAPIFHSHD
jgi:cyclopropane-fatty-acyl-phospholipid synthase